MVGGLVVQFTVKKYQGEQYKERTNMAKESKSFNIGRDSRTGRLESEEDARKHPSTSQVERIPKPGNGSAKK